MTLLWLYHSIYNNISHNVIKEITNKITIIIFKRSILIYYLFPLIKYLAINTSNFGFRGRNEKLRRRQNTIIIYGGCKSGLRSQFPNHNSIHVNTLKSVQHHTVHQIHAPVAALRRVLHFLRQSKDIYVFDAFMSIHYRMYTTASPHIGNDDWAHHVN